MGDLAGDPLQIVGRCINNVNFKSHITYATAKASNFTISGLLEVVCLD